MFPSNYFFMERLIVDYRRERLREAEMDRLARACNLAKPRQSLRGLVTRLRALLRFGQARTLPTKSQFDRLATQSIRDSRLKQHTARLEAKGG